MQESPRSRLRRLGAENGRLLLKSECNRLLGVLGDALHGPIEPLLEAIDDAIAARTPAMQLAARRRDASRLMEAACQDIGVTIEGGKWCRRRTVECGGSTFAVAPRQRIPADIQQDIDAGNDRDLDHRIRAAMEGFARSSDFHIDRLHQAMPGIIDDSLGPADDAMRSRLTKMLRTGDMNTGASNLVKAFASLAKDKAAILAERVRKETLRRDLALHLAFDDLRTMYREKPLAPRRVIAHIGPTNSGKTHQGMAELTGAATGMYLAPLRLMALEGRDRIASAGIAVDMLTGEDMQTMTGATHLSCTIEMMDMGRHYEVALIDEIQMLHDASRGWAWTRALVGVDADTVILAGSADALPMIERIVAVTGDTLEVHHHRRRAPLHALDGDVEIGGVRPGDAIVAFSRADVLALKDALSARHRVAAIYGALSPEVRNAEAARFSRGDADVLVATDAIGMGLNLPIRRVLFSTMTKYDGRMSRSLTDTEIRQVGGRAGRMGDMDSGGVGTFGMGRSAARTAAIRRSLAGTPRSPEDTRPYVWPTYPRLETAMTVHGYDTLSSMLKAMQPAIAGHEGVRCAIDADAFSLISMGEKAGLGCREQYGYLGCPLSLSGKGNAALLEQWMTIHAAGGTVTPPTFASDADLSIAERRVARATAYLWLSRRYPEAYPHGDIALATRVRGNEAIERLLRERNTARGRTGGRRT